MQNHETTKHIFALMNVIKFKDTNYISIRDSLMVFEPLVENAR
jgi:hypothetical protein